MTVSSSLKSALVETMRKLDTSPLDILFDMNEGDGQLVIQVRAWLAGHFTDEANLEEALWSLQNELEEAAE